MTTIKLKNTFREIEITTEHAASSYGIPVALIDGKVFGQADITPRPENDSLPWLEPETIAQTVAHMAARAGEGKNALVVKFLGR